MIEKNAILYVEPNGEAWVLGSDGKSFDVNLLIGENGIVHAVPITVESIEEATDET